MGDKSSVPKASEVPQYPSRKDWTWSELVNLFVMNTLQTSNTMTTHGALNVSKEEPAPLESSSSLSNTACSQAWWLRLITSAFGRLREDWPF